jgi:four helix bundle protein
VTCLNFGRKRDAEMRDFRDLKVWLKSHLMTLAVYKATRDFPKDELFGLTSQIRRSSASIAANIAEGCGRSSEAELARFLEIAMGSASELEYHLLLSLDLNLLSKSEHEKLNTNVVEVKQMLTSLIRKLRAES